MLFSLSSLVAYWLLKTEPSTYSFLDLVREKQTRWDGIRNPTALMHLRAAKKGDRALVYHTGSVKAAVGEAVLASAAYEDPKDAALSVIDIQAGKALAQGSHRRAAKADPRSDLRMGETLGHQKNRLGASDFDGWSVPAARQFG